MSEHKGQCFCGAVKFSVTGECGGAGYCHCASCRAWSAAPVNAFTLWPEAALTVTEGADKIGEYHKGADSNSYRKWCTACGGHLFTAHPKWKLVDVYAALLPSFDFKAGVHANYAETVLRIKDGVTKLKDFPPDLGGTGESVDE